MIQRGPDRAVDRTRISTNTLSHAVPVQRWANFIAGFSVEFVQQCLQGRHVSELVLDPFLGCGTTTVGARLSGCDVIGYDPHPVFSLLAEAKTIRWSESDLERVVGVIRSAKTSPSMSEPVEKFLSKLFEKSNLKKILAASRALETSDADLYPLGVTVLLRAAELTCGSQTDGIYKAPTTRKKSMSFSHSVSAVEQMIREDITSEWYQAFCSAGRAQVHSSSSTRMVDVVDSSVSSVITSPPYLNNFDFAEMTRMQLYILGFASSWSEITTRVRRSQITNTTTAPSQHRCPDHQANCMRELPQRLVKDLKPIERQLEFERTARPGKKPYNYLIYPYYHGILQVLRECFRALKPGGEIHWVVSDAALYGVYIATHEHTATLMKGLGFRGVRVEQLRKRGHRWVLKKRDGAPGKLGEYHIMGVKP